MQNTLTKPEWNIRRPPFLFICFHNIKNVFSVNKCHLFANESFCDTLDIQDVSQVRKMQMRPDNKLSGLICNFPTCLAFVQNITSTMVMNFTFHKWWVISSLAGQLSGSRGLLCSIQSVTMQPLISEEVNVVN
jgi:uncharacterized membrane protein